MFAKFLNKVSGTGAKAKAQLTKKDDLERLCLAAAGIMFADGDGDQTEYTAASRVIEGVFKGSFTSKQVEDQLDVAVKLFEAGKFSARKAMFNALKNVESSEEGEGIFAALLDVADASGGIGDQEKALLKDIADKLRVNPADYGY